MILILHNILKSYATLNHIIMEANRFNFCAEFGKNCQKLSEIVQKLLTDYRPNKTAILRCIIKIRLLYRPF